MHDRSRLTRVAAGLLASVTVASVAGCVRPVPTEAAPSAKAVDCSQVLVNLPDEAAGRERQETTAQSTAAWSGPELAPVVLRCGIEPPGPSTDPCTTVAGVDWLVDEQGDTIRYRTYGREPAVELLVPADAQDGVDVLLAKVAGAVSFLPADHACS